MGSKDEPPDLVSCYLTLLKDETRRVLLDAYYLSRLEQQWSTVPTATDEELTEMAERRDKLLASKKETQM
jgi:hypothetical protein